MIFDTHAHYDDEAFDGDRPELLGRLKEAGVGAVMNVAARQGSWTRRAYSGLRNSVAAGR